MARVYAVALALLVFALPSNGSAADLFVRISSNISYRNNLGTRGDEVGFGLRVPVELRMRPGGRSSGAISYTPQFDSKPTQRFASRINHLLKANGGYATSRRTSVAASIDFADLGFIAADRSDSPDGTLDLSQGSRRNTVSLQAAYNFAARWSLSGSVSYLLAEFDQRDRFDSDTVAGSLSLSYRHNAKNSFSLGINPNVSFYSVPLPSPFSGQVDQTVKSIGLSAGWNHQFSDALSLRLNFGPTLSEFDSESNVPEFDRTTSQVNYFGGAALTYTRARWGSSLRYRRTQSNQSGEGTSTSLNSLALDANWKATKVMSFQLAVRVSQRRVLNEDPLLPAVSRLRQDQISVRFSASRTLTERLRFKCAALYANQGRSRRSAAQENFRFEVSLSYSFRTVRL